VQQDRVYEVSGEMWFGVNPLSVQRVFDDIRATLLDNGQPLQESDAGERLQEPSLADSERKGSRCSSAAKRPARHRL
jgi:hypothetical protein